MVEAHDNADIADDETLIRRIDPENHFSWDHDRQAQRLSTKAFSSSSQPPYGMSVDVLGLMRSAQIDPVAFVTSPKYTGSVAFPAGVARGVGMRVGYDPLDATATDPANPYHAEIWGNPKPEKFSKAQQKALMSACNWFVEIPNELWLNLGDAA